MERLKSEQIRLKLFEDDDGNFYVKDQTSIYRLTIVKNQANLNLKPVIRVYDEEMYKLLGIDKQTL